MVETGYLYVFAAVLLLGIAKGGFGGVGASVALPIMVLGVPADLALGALLPVLLAMDAVSVTARVKQADRPAVLYALPGAVLGVLIGSAMIAILAADLIGFGIGVLAVLFAVIALTDFKPDVSHWPNWSNSVFGGLAGFTSALAHAGGPPIQIYFLSRGYDRVRFVATATLFMAALNVIKVVPFLVVGVLDWEAMKLALFLAPFAVAAALFGVWVSRVLSAQAFKFSLSALMLVAGIKLIADALV